MKNAIFTPKSTTIHRVSYHPETMSMDIEFRSGNVYRYGGVRERLWKLFGLYVECEGSPGQFFNEYIKGQYPSEKVLSIGYTEDLAA